MMPFEPYFKAFHLRQIRTLIRAKLHRPNTAVAFGSSTTKPPVSRSKKYFDKPRKESAENPCRQPIHSEVEETGNNYTKFEIFCFATILPYCISAPFRDLGGGDGVWAPVGSIHQSVMLREAQEEARWRGCTPTTNARRSPRGGSVEGIGKETVNLSSEGGT